MDPLDHENILFSEFLRHGRTHPLSGLKIKNRKINFFSVQKILHIPIELLHIDRFQTFKIIIAICITGRQLPIHKIIIHCDRMRDHPIDAQLDRKPMGKRRFAGGGRSCDQHKFDIFPICDLFRDLCDFPFLISFLYKNNLPHIPLCHHVIQRADRIDSLKISPKDRFFQNLK